MNLFVCEEKDMAEPVISFQDYGFQYAAQASPTLHHITLDIYLGEKVLIAGASGSGKSTVGNCINGLIPFAYPGESTGKLFVGGVEAKESSIFDFGKGAFGARHQGAALSDGSALCGRAHHGRNIAPACKQPFPDKGAEGKSTCLVCREEETLKICGLYPFRKWPVSALSFGQKKRVTIAGILVQRPRIILMDEPTAGQDYRHYTEIMEFLKTLNAQGFTIVMITHDMQDGPFLYCRALYDHGPAAFLSSQHHRKGDLRGACGAALYRLHGSQ